MAKVELHKVPQWECLQGHLEHAPKLPARLILVGPSNSGKSQLLIHLILSVWTTAGGRSCFERIVLFSASHGLDSVWYLLEKFQT